MGHCWVLAWTRFSSPSASTPPKQPVRARFACVLRTGPTSHICGCWVHSNGLRFFVRMTRGGTRGILSGEPYNAPRCNIENTKQPELHFRTMLGEGTSKLKLALV
jgi:hypothetical protein